MFNFEPIKNDELIRMGLDFDGVLAQLSKPPKYEMGEINEGTEWALNEMVKLGFKPHIFTARPDPEYSHLEQWAEHYNLPIRGIRTGKPLFKWMPDDRAIEFDPTRPLLSWVRAIYIMKTGKLPWFVDLTEILRVVGYPGDVRLK